MTKNTQGTELASNIAWYVEYKDILTWAAPSLVALLVGGFAAYLTIRTLKQNRAIAEQHILENRELAKKKAAIEALQARKLDKNLEKSMEKVREIHVDHNIDIKKYAIKGHTSHEDAYLIRYALNYYESVAVAIHNDIYCDKLVQQSIHSVVVRLHDCCQPYLDELYTTNQLAYTDLKAMVARWKERPLKQVKERS